jgi:hypothetical protein
MSTVPERELQARWPTLVARLIKSYSGLSHLFEALDVADPRRLLLEHFLDELGLSRESGFAVERWRALQRDHSDLETAVRKRTRTALPGGDQNLE